MSDERKMIEFDEAMLKRLKAAKVEAETADKDMFTFEGNEYLVSYATYLIEYLERRFASPNYKAKPKAKGEGKP